MPATTECERVQISDVIYTPIPAKTAQHIGFSLDTTWGTNNGSSGNRVGS